MLTCDAVHSACLINAPVLTPKESQIIEHFASRSTTKTGVGLALRTDIHKSPNKPAIKTYARKTSQAPNLDVNSFSLAFLPPCYSSLVGFRGLLLHQRHLLQVANSETSEDSPTVKKSTFHRYREDKDNVLIEGISHADVMDASSGSEIREQAQDEKVADEKLFQRYKALFFWPAVMSTVK